MRTLLRSTAELAATASGLAALARHAARARIAVLAYHNVVPVDDVGNGDASLHLSLPAFIDQVERLAQTHDIVDLARTSEPHASHRPRAAITFDDAYRGAVTLALPELRRRGLPATVFVAPALLGARGTWWDELAQAGLLSDHTRDNALVELAGRTDDVRRRAFGLRTPPSLPDSFAIATADELRQHCVDGITLGSHTWAHEYLPALPLADAAESLQRSLEWLGASGITHRRWLALPYGGGSCELGRSALRLGYEGVLRISGGLWDVATGNLACLPRINVPAGVSLRGLELRTCGLLGR